ncbi:uncharacterized protein H6S33_001756 [Morchella sextelata]|uniref:uncharacterized protein n=1 Tax=Morchella sextelata TaxID=1174677 RepID=UPI001D0462BD|nr:uncharacterized protein H6S33_001756 [Morchella sextelata]KAH0608622.1 hypothetical protein H6S33_001756 [Morchella sextelata]
MMSEEYQIKKSQTYVGYICRTITLYPVSTSDLYNISPRVLNDIISARQSLDTRARDKESMQSSPMPTTIIESELE